MENYINLNEKNLESEHICCAISDKKHQLGVSAKKEWLKERIKEGHTFRKLDAQGKIFIEYSVLDKAWVPIEGKNYLYIYCLWVAGSYKGKGYGNCLLEYAIEEAKNKNMNGICVLSSKKKKPFLAEKSFFEKYGFKSVDSIKDYELLALQFKEELPKFNDYAKKMSIDNKKLTIYYSPECPYIMNSIKEIKEYLKENDIEIDFNEIRTLEEAKKVPCIFNNWAVFINGKFSTNTILNKNSLNKLIKESN